MSEDCLYLNVFTPLLIDSSSATSRPVMIFIHGGGFQNGYASDPTYNAEHLANTSNVIIALIQYRLGKDRLLSSIAASLRVYDRTGILGFFATGNGPNDIKGNYGILDQRLAIAWIKGNVAAFGGDPNAVRPIKRHPMGLSSYSFSRSRCSAKVPVLSQLRYTMSQATCSPSFSGLLFKAHPRRFHSGKQHYALSRLVRVHVC